MKAFFTSFWAIFVLLPLSSRSDDWPIFRGPGGNGISKETGWASTLPEAPVLWKTRVGLGYSAATISRGKVFITGHDGAESDQIFCFDEETGRQLWIHTYPQPKGDLYFQGGTTASVTAQGDRIFHLAREGNLFCLNAADGKVIWVTHLVKDHGYTKPTWGFSGAPFPLVDRLYVTAGVSGIALNQSDGGVVWKSENEEAGYATPYHFARDGKDRLIFTSKRYYTCVEADTGIKLWEVKWMTRYGVNAADPIVSGDYLFLSTGYDKGASLFRREENGEPALVWRNRDMRNQMNASILVDGFLYGIDGDESGDGTALKCMEMSTGETKWSEASVGHGTVSVADGKLIVLTEQGELQIAPVSPGAYRPTFSQKILKPRVWTVPVVANGRVYCRNAGGDLVVVDLRQK